MDSAKKQMTVAAASGVLAAARSFLDDEPAKGHTIRNTGQTPRRNQACPCGSGRKFKKCCGKPKHAEPVRNPYQQMAAVYTDEQKAAVQQFILRFGFQPNPSQLMAFMEGDEEECRATVIKALRAMGERTGADNGRFIYGVQQTGYLITPLNQGRLDDETKRAWQACLEEYRQQEADQAEAAD